MNTKENKKMITRKDYMQDSSNLFDAYFAQFITQASIDFIKNNIGLKKLKTSKDKHLNDLYSHSHGGRGGWIWDNTPMNITLARELGEVAPNGLGSQATHTCIGKTVARMMLNGSIESGA